MGDSHWLWVWGAAGAVIFAAPSLGLAIYADPSNDEGADRRHRSLAVFNFILAVFTGAVFGQLMAELAQFLADRINFHMRLAAAAMIIGLASNFIWPRILRKLGQRIDTGGLEAFSKLAGPGEKTKGGAE